MTVTPPDDLIEFVRSTVSDLVRLNPLAPSSEKYIQYHVEFELLRSGAGYHLRIGINYRGAKVQEVRIRDGMLVGWNAAGQALGRGGNAKMLLAGHTIVERDANEQLMSDSKFSGGRLPDGKYVRTEFKTRGWLGQTRNLDGKQLEKDIDLLHAGQSTVMNGRPLRQKFCVSARL